MKITKEKLFQYLAVPVLALAIYASVVLLYRWLGLPEPEQIIAWAQGYYERYGYWVVLFGALAEGALFINWYLPGSVVVALGVVFARQSGLNIFVMLGLVIAGFFVTALLNYAFGRYGWYHMFMKVGLKQPLEKIKSRVEKIGLKVLFSTYVHPNFGALAATSAGILKLDFWKFALASLAAITLWNSFWTLVFYWFGAPLLKHLNIFVAVAGLFVFLMLARSLKKTENQEHINVP